MSPRHRRAHAILFLFWSIVPITKAGSLFLGFRDPLFLVAASFALAWMVAGVMLLRNAPWAAWLALALIAFPLALGAAQTAEYALFVVREGGFERADGYGSPMAFLMDFTLLQMIVVIPLVVLSVLVVRALRRANSRCVAE